MIMKCKIELLDTAWKELDEISDYYLLTVGPQSAKKITQRIFSAIERLEVFPLSGSYVPDIELKNQGYRMLICDEYLCIYKLIGDTVYIYHIAHGSMEYGKFKY